MAKVQLRIEEDVMIAGPSETLGSSNMVYHPDGSIWLNTTLTDPGFFRSVDQGRTWEAVGVKFDASLGRQDIASLYIARDGTLWTVHQAFDTGLAPGEELDVRVYISHSRDEAKSWSTQELDYGSFAPGAPADPYVKMEVTACHPNFIERPDGTLMFSASMRYEDWDQFKQADQKRPGIRDVMIRTTDGGRTWGDPTVVHQHATETAYAVDPNDADHIIAATRIQRFALPGEDDVQIMRDVTAVPYKSGTYCYKNGLLLESRDGGRTFAEVPDALFGFGSYRWTALWDADDLMVLVSFAGQEVGEDWCSSDHIVRVSVNGGRTWDDGTEGGTTSPCRATKHLLVGTKKKDEVYSSVVAATVRLEGHRFLSIYKYKQDWTLMGRFWRLEIAD
ncbi:MAG: hypothetical protein CMJ49_13910 [Planctomycetaceae bacterium]|nr:hypothetical protein [Planctomycetaceae bacterium]